MSRIKVAVIQMGADGDKSENLHKALSLIDQAIERHPGLDLVVLPEYCNGEPTPPT